MTVSPFYTSSLGSAVAVIMSALTVGNIAMAPVPVPDFVSVSTPLVYHPDSIRIEHDGSCLKRDYVGCTHDSYTDYDKDTLISRDVTKTTLHHGNFFKNKTHVGSFSKRLISNGETTKYFDHTGGLSKEVRFEGDVDTTFVHIGDFSRRKTHVGSFSKKMTSNGDVSKIVDHTGNIAVSTTVKGNAVRREYYSSLTSEIYVNGLRFNLTRVNVSGVSMLVFVQHE